MSPEQLINSRHLDIIENIEDDPVQFGLSIALDEDIELVVVADDPLEPSELNQSEDNRIDFEGIEDFVEKLKSLDSLEGKWLKLNGISDVKDIAFLMRLSEQQLEAGTYNLLFPQKDLLNFCNIAISREDQKYRLENHLKEIELLPNNNNRRDYLMKGPQISEFVGKAACKGMEVNLFFPSTGVISRAVAVVCSNCEVKVQCEEFAVNNDNIQGIWGGTNEADRRRKRKTKNITSNTTSNTQLPY